MDCLDLVNLDFYMREMFDLDYDMHHLHYSPNIKPIRFYKARSTYLTTYIKLWLKYPDERNKLPVFGWLYMDYVDYDIGYKKHVENKDNKEFLDHIVNEEYMPGINIISRRYKKIFDINKRRKESIVKQCKKIKLPYELINLIAEYDDVVTTNKHY